MKYTDEQLKNLTVEKRRNLYDNAKATGSEAAEAIIAQIDRLGLPLSSGGVSFSDPVHAEMTEIIWSREGQEAALAAVERGLPGLAGVDPLLQRRMGKRYSAENMRTVAAGSLVGEVMRHKGYDKDRESVPLPPDCIAKTAASWKRKVPLK